MDTYNVYVCNNSFSVSKYDEEGFSLENKYFTVKEGSKWVLIREDHGTYHLDSISDGGWLGISYSTLSNNFKKIDSPIDGLIVKGNWLDLILYGKKDLEIRGSSTNKLFEPIYLLESKTRKVRGICCIDSVSSITREFWESNKNRHCVDMSYDELLSIYKTPYAWSFSNIKSVDDNLYYNHKRGSIIWVKNVELYKGGDNSDG